MLKKILLSTVLTFTLSLSSVALAGGAGLTAKQIQQLKSLGFPIILPAIVPQGFKVANFEVTDSTDKGKRYTSYFISYEKKLKNKKLTEFTLHGLNGQLPNSQYAPSTLVNSSIANFIMYVDPLDGNFNYKQKLNNCVLTDYVYIGDHSYQITSGSGCDMTGEFDETHPTVRLQKDDAIKIIQSLKIMK